MTGEQLKQFVKDQGWTNEQAINILHISRATLFRQYNKSEIDGTLALICELWVLAPKTKLSKLL